jgi:N-acyl-phosphatidylethanolamine-hydrolysing phospholipase D
VACAVLGIVSCSTSDVAPDRSKAHHSASGFRNNYPNQGQQSFWKWQWQKLRQGLPHKPAAGYHFDSVTNNVAALHNPSVTWVGHSTLLLRVGGLNILTDPHFSQRASPLSFAGPKRVVAPAIKLTDLPHIDAVLISHNHYDHLDRPTVTALAAQPGGSPKFYVGLGLAKWFGELGISNVEELDWWEARSLAGVDLHFVPVQHWSARTPWDTNQTLWGGFVVEHPSLRFFFAGDTGYSRDFQDIAQRFGPIDLAAIPIGAYAPRWFMQAHHVNPAEAVQIHLDLKARYSLAIHWGTFDDLTDESLYDPPVLLRTALAGRAIDTADFWVLQHGESRSLAFLRGSDADESPHALSP